MTIEDPGFLPVHAVVPAGDVSDDLITRLERLRKELPRLETDAETGALDVRLDQQDEPQVRTRGWREGGGQSLWEVLALYPHGSVRHVLCTDIARDGALAGPNFGLYSTAVGRFPHIAWQASGGVRDALDLRGLADVGVAAAISGKALLERRITPEELRAFLPDASSPA